MGYFWDTSTMESSAQYYANIMGGMDRVTIGVGVAYDNGASTPLSEVATLATYAKKNGAGMMLFPTNNDNPTTDPNQQQVFQYCTTIAQNLGVLQSVG
jgi:hypothetical protein